MHVDVRKIEDVIIVDLDGDLVAGVGDVVLREVVDELVAEGWKRILINLERVNRMDSSGIGEMVASWKLAQRFGGSLKLYRPNDRVRSTLHLSQVLPLLDVFEDEPQAVSSFATE